MGRKGSLRESHVLLFIQSFLAQRRLVEHAGRFWAPLSLDAAAVSVVRIGPEEVADGPDDNDAW